MTPLKFFRNHDFRYTLRISYAAVLVPAGVLGIAIVYPVVRRMVESHFERELRNSNEAMDGPPAIVLRTRREGGWARIEIEDTGPWMSEEARRRIFGPFYTTLQLGGGTGLGSSVSCFIIMENHGGRVSVEPDPGRGAGPLSGGRRPGGGHD